MEKPNEVSSDNFDEIFDHLEEVYGNATWALRYGATKEDLLAQIEEALECHQQSLHQAGWLIGPDTEAAAGRSLA